MTHLKIANDPVYLREPYVNSEEFVLMERGNQNWLYNCEYAMEVPTDKNKVPHFLAGKNPFMKDFSNKFGLPFDAIWSGAESTYPEYLSRIASGNYNRPASPAAPAANARPRPAAPNSTSGDI